MHFIHVMPDNNRSPKIKTSQFYTQFARKCCFHFRISYAVKFTLSHFRRAPHKWHIVGLWRCFYAPCPPITGRRYTSFTEISLHSYPDNNGHLETAVYTEWLSQYNRHWTMNSGFTSTSKWAVWLNYTIWTITDKNYSQNLLLAAHVICWNTSYIFTFFSFSSHP